MNITKWKYEITKNRNGFGGDGSIVESGIIETNEKIVEESQKKEIKEIKMKKKLEKIKKILEEQELMKTMIDFKAKSFIKDNIENIEKINDKTKKERYFILKIYDNDNFRTIHYFSLKENKSLKENIWTELFFTTASPYFNDYNSPNYHYFFHKYGKMKIKQITKKEYFEKI